MTIAKIATALSVAVLMLPSFALADENKTRTASTTTITTQQSTCMQNATSAKDSANLTAFDTLYTSIRAALVTRKTATMAAWGNLDGTARIEALVKANTAFATSSKSAWTTYKASRKVAQATFKAAATSCGVKENGKVLSNRNDDDDKKEGKRIGKWINQGFKNFNF